MAAVQTFNGLPNGESTAKKIRSKNQLRRAKIKQRKATSTQGIVSVAFTSCSIIHLLIFFSPKQSDKDTDVESQNELVTPHQNVQYVSEQLDLQDSVVEAFSNVLARFQLPSDENSVSFSHRFHTHSIH
jgi:splicing factor 3B subunit 2